ncbi:MAG: alanine--tRNA ligase-related protein, partial [Hyphomicrobiales bacterium]|nr:alanine--tRNA ligase-related protein [Hyphomicrobiales bacterium]
ATGDMGEGDVLEGEVAFKLYDTYGFPLDLTEDALRTRGIRVDTDGFDAAMERQREEARKAWAGSGEAATEAVWFELREELGASEFLGYGTETAEGEVLALVADGERAERLEEGQEGCLVLNQTPFYGESGGQVGDRGVIATADGDRFVVSNTQKKLGDLFVHMGKVAAGRFSAGTPVQLDVDHARRTATRANHSATHLLHEALRQVLGDHVAQKGSLVDPDRLRFDFSHPKPVADEEIHAIEAMANAMVLQNGPVDTHLMAVDDAIAAGALALFGEKYGEEVRVVSMGTSLEGEKAGKPYSIELCGGTHVRRTGDIGLVKIVNESAVAAGVRRIEALTAEGARTFLDQQDERVRTVADMLKTSVDELIPRLEAVLEGHKKLERDLAETRRQLALGGGANGGDAAVRDLGAVKLLARTVEGIPPKDLPGLVDDGKRQIGSGVVAIIGVSDEGKAGIVVGVTDDLTGDYDAVELVRAGAEALGGKGGGGRADMARAGGPDGSQAEAALDVIADRLSERAGA